MLIRQVIIKKERMLLGDKMFKGAIWSGFERIAGQSIQFALGIILARLLTPEEYGTIALILIFIVVSQVFVDSGFTQALIQKKNRDENDISTVFLFNMGISVLCYILIWFSSPLIASFFEISELSILLRIMAISLMINGIFTVPNTLLTIDLNFKAPAKVYLVSTTIAGLIAIYLAYTGFGVWALVWQTLIRSVLMAFGLWFSVKWRPRLVFSKNSFDQLFSYGSKLLLASLLTVFFSKLNEFLIGKYIGAKDLGFYSRGVQFTGLVSTTFNSMVNKIFLPSLAPFQDDIPVLVKQTKKIITTTTLISVPIFLTLAIIAKPLILVLLTEKWIAAAPIMQIFCFSRMITVISNINVNLLYVVGKTNLVLRQEYFKVGIRVILIVAALPFGIVYIALAEMTATLIHFFINSYYPGKIMDFGPIKQIKAVAPLLLAGLVMTVPMVLINMFIDNNYLKISLSLIAGSLVYFFCMKLMNISDFEMLILKIKQIISKGK